MWGSYGQSAYSAANAFLDGLTWRLRERGVPGISVNFGPWSAGMADQDARAQLDRRGIKTLSPTDALAGMADVMAADGSQGPAEAVVARIDWARFLPIYLQAGRRSLLAEVAREVPESVPAATGASGTTRLVEQLTAAPVQQRKKLVLEYLRNTVAEVTRVDASEVREEAGFFDLGMDSLMAVELRRRLEQAVGKELPATLAMDFPRLTDVADYILGDVLNLNEKAGAQLAAAPASLASAATDEPIAIIALACRFPGAPDADAYWDVLSGAVDAIREIPEDRFDVDQYYDPDQQTPGKIYTRSGGYLESVDGFDPEFFGISPREAVWIDPQQRLMLEIAWEGLERAGYSPHRCAAAAPASSSVWAPTSTPICCPVSRSRTSKLTSSPATRSTRSQAGWPSPWAWKARRWRWTPRAARRWSPSIRRRRHFTPVTAIWRWPVA